MSYLLLRKYIFGPVLVNLERKEITRKNCWIVEIPRAQWNGTSGCTDPTQATARLVIVLASRIQKRRYWGQQFCQMERNISDRTTEITRPVKEDHLQSWSRISGRTKPKWSVPFDVATGITGSLGWMESAPWLSKSKEVPRIYLPNLFSGVNPLFTLYWMSICKF